MTVIATFLVGKREGGHYEYTHGHPVWPSACGSCRLVRRACDAPGWQWAVRQKDGCPGRE